MGKEVPLWGQTVLGELGGAPRMGTAVSTHIPTSPRAQGAGWPPGSHALASLRGPQLTPRARSSLRPSKVSPLAGRDLPQAGTIQAANAGDALGIAAGAAGTRGGCQGPGLTWRRGSKTFLSPDRAGGTELWPPSPHHPPPWGACTAFAPAYVKH